MATLASLADAKLQLEILDSSRDTQVQMYLDIATDYVCKMLDDANPPPAPSLRGAVLLAVGELDAKRGTTIELRLQDNKIFMQLIQPYRKRIGV